MLEIAPQLEQAIIAKSQENGVSVNQFLSNLILPEPYLDSELEAFKPNQEQAQFIQMLLDNPPPPSKEMLDLIKEYKEWYQENNLSN